MVESSTRRFKTICVFGSTEFSKNKEHLKATTELSITLAVRKIDLVYRRDSFGLRDTIIVSVNIRGSTIIGVILKALAEKKYIIGMIIGKELQVLNMYERMAYMNYNTEAYIILTRGLEILEDVFNITS